MRITFLVLISVLFCFCSPAANPWSEGEAFHPSTNAAIVWKETNRFPSALWTYKVMSNAVAGAVITNAMSIGQFQMKDLSKTDHAPFQDKFLIYFQNKNEFNRPKFLIIAPSIGAIKFESQKDYTAAVEDVPSADEAEVLARNVLFELGIDRSLLSGKVRKGYDEVKGRADRQGHKLGDEKVISRGVSFERRVDGVALSDNWCFLIHFGSHARIEDFSLLWRNLLPSESHPTLSQQEITEMVKSGEATLPPQFSELAGLATAHKFYIQTAIPKYYNGSAREPLDLLVPFLEMQMSADSSSSGSINFVLRCPITASGITVARAPVASASQKEGRQIIPTEALNVLESADDFFLYSINPNPEPKTTNAFHGYEVLGKVAIKGARERQTILDSLYASISLQGPEAMCFNPRHAIQATKGTNTEDLVICFECGQVYFYGTAPGKLVVKSGPESKLNSILSAAGIPVSK